MTEKYRVTLDSEIDNSFSVHISANHMIKFICGSNGLYCFDASKIDLSKLRTAFSFLSTVSDNLEFPPLASLFAEGTLLIGLRASPVRDSEFPNGPSQKHGFRMKFGP